MPVIHGKTSLFVEDLMRELGAQRVEPPAFVRRKVRSRISSLKTIPPRHLGGYGSSDDSRTHPGLFSRPLSGIYDLGKRRGRMRERIGQRRHRESAADGRGAARIPVERDRNVVIAANA